jgi:hypothetical protein
VPISVDEQGVYGGELKSDALHGDGDGNGKVSDPYRCYFQQVKQGAYAGECKSVALLRGRGRGSRVQAQHSKACVGVHLYV